MKKRIKLIILFLFISFHLWSQTDDFGVWTTLELEKKLMRWSFTTEAELRTLHDSKDVARWNLELGAVFDISKHLKIGASYQFIYFHDFKYADYQPRNRFILYLTGKKKFGNFSISLRERAQMTTKDDSDRIKKSGKIDTYKMNPEYSWRNRVKVAYYFETARFEPAFSFESFYSLKNPDGNTFDDLRYSLSITYYINKHQEIEIYGLIDKEINVKNPVKTSVAGFGYNYSF